MFEKGRSSRRLPTLAALSIVLQLLGAGRVEDVVFLLLEAELCAREMHSRRSAAHECYVGSS